MEFAEVDLFAQVTFGRRMRSAGPFRGVSSNRIWIARLALGRETGLIGVQDQTKISVISGGSDAHAASDSS